MAGTELGKDTAGHAALLWTTTVLWMLYKPLFSGPAKAFIPDHTREACFQLFCDLRTNSPKDRKWLSRHMQALTPRTLIGWVAVTAASLFASSFIAGVLSFALTVAAVAFSTGLLLVGGVGFIVAFCIGGLAISMAVTSFWAVGGGCFIGAGFVGLSIINAVFQFLWKFLAPKPLPVPASHGLPEGFAGGFPQPPRLPAGIDLSRLVPEPNFDSFSSGGYQMSPPEAVRRPMVGAAAAAAPTQNSAPPSPTGQSPERPASSPREAFAPAQCSASSPSEEQPQELGASASLEESTGGDGARVPTPEPMQQRAASGNGSSMDTPPPTAGSRQNGGKENSGVEAGGKEKSGEATTADKPAGGSVGTSEPAKVVAQNTVNTTHAALASNFPQRHRTGPIRAKAMGDAGVTGYSSEIAANPWAGIGQLRGAPTARGGGRRNAMTTSFASSFVL